MICYILQIVTRRPDNGRTMVHLNETNCYSTRRQFCWALSQSSTHTCARTHTRTHTVNRNPACPCPQHDNTCAKNVNAFFFKNWSCSVVIYYLSTQTVVKAVACMSGWWEAAQSNTSSSTVAAEDLWSLANNHPQTLQSCQNTNHQAQRHFLPHSHQHAK